MAEWNLTLDQAPDDAFLRAHDAACRIGVVRQASSEFRTLEADLNSVKIRLVVSVHPAANGRSILQASTVTNADDVPGDPWSEARRQFVAALGNPKYKEDRPPWWIGVVVLVMMAFVYMVLPNMLGCNK